jgi:hypothetical protein
MFKNMFTTERTDLPAIARLRRTQARRAGHIEKKIIKWRRQCRVFKFDLGVCGGRKTKMYLF